MAKVAQITANGPDGGSAHVVGFGDLRVMIIRDGENEWYAQSLEIDYIAQGQSLESVQSAFEAGLKKTIEEHLKLYGDIKKLLKAAPQEVWAEFYEHTTSCAYRYSQISTHVLTTPASEVSFVASTKEVPVRQAPRVLPFKRIAYLAHTPHDMQIPA